MSLGSKKTDQVKVDERKEDDLRLALKSTDNKQSEDVIRPATLTDRVEDRATQMKDKISDRIRTTEMPRAKEAITTEARRRTDETKRTERAPRDEQMRPDKELAQRPLDKMDDGSLFVPTPTAEPTSTLSTSCNPYSTICLIRDEPSLDHTWACASFMPSTFGRGTTSPTPQLNQAPPVPKSLVPYMQTNHLNTIRDKELSNFAGYIAPRILTREADTDKFLWQSPSPLEQNSRFYTDVRNLATYLSKEDRETAGIWKLDDIDQCRRRLRSYYTRAVCDEIRSIAKFRLSSISHSKAEQLYLDERVKYLKTLAVVCDSYAQVNCMSNCDNACDPIYPLDRSLCNIKPGQYRKKRSTSLPMSTGTAWTVPCELLRDSIYDAAAMDHMATSCLFPTPLMLSLRKDYRAPRIDWAQNRALSLPMCLRWGCKNLHKPDSDTDSPLSRRIALRDHCTLRSNDICNWLDRFAENGYSREGLEECTDSTRCNKEQIAQRMVDWCEENCDDSNLHTYKQSQNSYHCLQSLRPIDLWLSQTWAEQVKQQCIGCKDANKCGTECYRGPPIHQNDEAHHQTLCECDVRSTPVLFLKDISTLSRKFSSNARTAARNWTDARDHHRKTCKALSRRTCRANRVRDTSLQHVLFNSDPELPARLQRHKLNRQLPQVWDDLSDWMMAQRQFATNRSIRLRSQKCQQPRRDIEQKSPRLDRNNVQNSVEDTTRTQTNAPVREPGTGYNIDPKGRPISTVWTPSTLKGVKLRQVYPQWRNSDEWFPWLSTNQYVGRPIEHDELPKMERRNSGTNIIDSILRRIEKLF